MRVWYSARDNKILSDYAHKKYFDSLMDSLETDDKFKSFLAENYSPIELFRFTKADRDKAEEDFAFWVYENAKTRDTYKSYEVQFVSDEVEE